MNDAWKTTEPGESVMMALDASRLAGIEVAPDGAGSVGEALAALSQVPSAAAMIAEADAQVRLGHIEQMQRDHDEGMRRIAELMDPMRGVR